MARPASGNRARAILFLSHSGADAEAARELRRRILASPAARDAGLEVWFDKDDLVPGKGWQDQLEQVLSKEATAFAVYVGSKGVINWVEREVRLALSRATSAGDFPFIPILAPESAGSAALPPFAAQYHGVRDPLGDEKALAALIRAALGGGTGKAVLTDQPFVGLRAMTEEWADRFFGREREANELAALMRRHRLVAIVAESGAGKSSLAMAGFAPCFRGGALEEAGGREPDGRLRHVVIMRPGADPVSGLKDGIDKAARALGLDDDRRYRLRERVDPAKPYETAHAIRCDLPPERTQTLLIVDQFEELLTQTQQAARQSFINLLLSLAENDFHVLLTVRSDYSYLLNADDRLWQRLAQDKSEPVYRLRRISNEGLADVVKRPLVMAGLSDSDEIEALAQLFKRDMMDQPGDLALVQMALDAVWRRRKQAGGLSKAYASVGGIAGALAHEADAVRTGKLNDKERALLVPLFVRLVRLGDTGGVTRRAATFDELGEARAALARKLTSPDCARLLATVSSNSVELAHEALVTQWAWLQNQIGGKEIANSIRRLGNLADDAAAWMSATETERSQTLANPADFVRFSALKTERGDWLSGPEANFVSESGAAIRREESRRYRLTNAAIAATTASVLLLLLMASYLILARSTFQRALENQTAALAASQRALENQTAALAALSSATRAERPDIALKLALAAWPRDEADRATPRLQASLDAIDKALMTPHLIRVLRGHGGPVNGIAWSPDGARLATRSKDKTGRVWDAVTGQEIAVLKGHADEVHSIAWSPDGRRLATTSKDGTGRVWDAVTGQEIAVLKGHADEVHSIAWSPDATRLATISKDKTGRVWDAVTGREIATLKGHESEVTSLAWSPDGTRLATASGDTTGRIWDAATGRELAVLRGHEGSVHRIAWSPDGTRLATVSADNTGRIWDAATSRELAVLRGHEGSVNDIAWSPDGTRLATVSADSTGRIWDAATARMVASLRGREGPMFNVAWSPDGTQLATTSLASTGRLWDAATGRETAVLKGHEGVVNDIVWSPDGTRLATASQDSTGRLWDAVTARKAAILRGHSDTVNDIAWSPDGTRLATTSLDSTGRVWDAVTSRETAVLRGHEGNVNDITWSPDGRRLATASDDHTGRVWDAVTGREIAVLRGHADYVGRIAWSGDGRRLATASWDRTGRVWDAETGHEIAILRGNKARVNHVAWSPDGTRLATASDDGTGRVWEAATGREIAVLRGHTAHVYRIAWSPDSRWLATVSEDRTGRVWNAATGRETAVLRGHEHSVYDIAWSPDGMRLATASGDGTGRVWDAATGQEVVVLRGHEGEVTPIVWSPDGTRLATASRDKTVRVWDALTGREIAILTGNGNDVYPIAWNPDGTRLAAGSSDSTGRVWDLRSIAPGNLFQIACAHLPDSNVSDLVRDYGIVIDRPICQKPAEIPLPSWSSKSGEEK